MYGWRFVLGLGLVGLACGGEAAVGDGVDASSGGANAAAGGGAGNFTSGGRVSTGGAPFGGSASGGQGTGGSPFVDPGCPNVAPPDPVKECDPLSAEPQCPFGTGCYPYVDHPFGAGCETQTFGALCLAAGTGVQGAACGDGAGDCAPSFICVVGAHPGRHCAKLCTFDGAGACPPGMICGDVDIQGYGVCF